MIGQNVRRASPSELNFVISFKRINYTNNYQRENDHESTGSLISRKDVLTSEHGFAFVQTTGFEILVGSVDLRAGRTYSAIWWITHTQWSTINRVPIKNPVNDIAIIRLSEEVSREIDPVPIMPVSPSYLYGLNVRLAGWGATIEGHMSRYLETAILTVLSKDECENKIEKLVGQRGYLPENVICSVANPFIVTTAGNSGCPVLFNDKLVAIHHAIGPELQNSYSDHINIHLSIENFIDYIHSVLNVP
ncbi:PREDICTED: trypsin iota-like [Ceratosolen solmsi marchali]|uniref:Trypsin iota-like n=1 Tax=Ceratosolen solmsi marchali TaxID=326594 RepID=A0AAJ6YCB7_9HYME|nr:PREDICTED: trypsin iota-like [Ceratosolen solmsi marchali]